MNLTRQIDMINSMRSTEAAPELNNRSMNLTGRYGTGQLISDEVQAVLVFILYVGLAGSVSLCGCVTNAINTTVFSRQSLQESASVCLLLLSMCDLGECVTSLLYSIMFAIDRFSPSRYISIYDLSLLLSSLPRSELSMCTTVVMSLERCLCISRPLTFRHFINRRNTVIILGCLYAEVATSSVLQYFSYPMSQQWDNRTNTSLLKLVHTKGPESLSVTVHHLLNNVVLTTAAMAIVIVCTCVMVSGLKASTKFRLSATATNTNKNPDHMTTNLPIRNQEVNTKDKRLVQMVTLVSIIFLACHAPVMSVLLAKKLVPDLNMYGRYHDLNDILWALLYFTASVNATVTIFVYLKTSTNYKRQVRRLFTRAAPSSVHP